ncbi:MAG: hypothetical protein ACLUTU_09355 [Blautia faecis]
MNIRPSAAIRQNYNEIAELCRKTAEPVFLTKNGEEIWSLWILKPITAGKDAETPRGTACG